MGLAYHRLQPSSAFLCLLLLLAASEYALPPELAGLFPNAGT
jgi:hypothetical protein